MKEPLEDLVRRKDEDRWLSSRFAPAPVRKRLIALYALNYEIAASAERVSDPALGDMRLQFWSDAIGALFAGAAPPAHPVMAPLGEAIKAAALPRAPFDAMIAARALDLESAPFESWTDLEAYLDATAGGVLDLAIRICAPERQFDAALDNFVRAGGRAWGYTGLVRALAHWSARGRTFFPKSLREHLAIDDAALLAGASPDHAAASAARSVLDRGEGVLRDVMRFSPAAPKEAFPATGYLALTRVYIRDAARARDRLRDPFRTSLLARQIRLVGAAATGSL